MKNENFIYFFVSFLFFNAFFAPLFRTEATFCDVSILTNPEYFSAYNVFLSQNAVYLKVVVFLYLLNHINYIGHSFKKLFIVHLFFIYLFIQALITENTLTQVISLLNTLLFIYFILITVNKKLLSQFLIYLTFFIFFVIIFSVIFLIFGESSFVVTKCYTGSSFFGIREEFLGPGGKISTNLAGITSHKNTLGTYIFVLNFLLIYYKELKLGTTVKTFILIISIILLLFIDSITSLLLTIVISVPFFTKKNKYFFILSFIVFLTLILFNVEFFLNMLGRDTTFTGRLFIWQNILSQLEGFPIIGKGLGNYGLTDSTYIKLLIECGVVFTIVYISWIAVQLFSNISISITIDSSAIYLAVLLYSITEGLGLIYSTNLVILIMFITYFKKLNEGTIPEKN